jgi:hypothetical protein
MVVRITDGKGNAWTAGAADNRTTEVLRAMRILDSRSSLWPEPGTKLEGKKKRSGLVCGRARADRDHEFCFDPSTGILVRDRIGKIAREYTSYEAFGSKLYPRVFRTFADSRLQAEIVVTELLAPSALDASLFSPVAQAERSRWCRRFDPAYPARTLLPPQPAISATFGEERATLTAKVSVSGPVQLVEIKASLPQLHRYAIDAVQRWQFQPAVCDGRNVEGEVRIEIRMRCGGSHPTEARLNCETSSQWFLQSELGKF